MKVKDLIAELKEKDQDLEVILSSDAEGNSFNKLDAVESFSFEDDDGSIGIDEEDELGENCVILFPV